MRYLLVINSSDSTVYPDDMGPRTEAWVEETTRTGARITGSRTRPESDATTVRVRDGQTLLTDGPFTETKEQMAGFDIIEAADLDEAIAIAAKHPMAQACSVQLRPFWE